ncbi:Uncharacterized protein OBRU01_05477 [Operophtera brumata]|uniref:DUF1279 domain-containing protein n=1 Tax=Operophtera brumata TaxID=104452 RepID=A0A0L7L4W3_OPEBR|nr:Uncharacterized protein OBRU01_05477 [Operophtera brumata]
MTYLGQSPVVKTKHNCRYRKGYRYLFLYTTVFGGGLLVIYLNTTPGLILDTNRHESVRLEESFTIKTDGCTIPGMQPFDETIIKFIKRPRNVNQCTNYSLLQNNDTHIWMTLHRLQFYKMPGDANVSCCYKSFYRPSAIADISAVDVDDRVKYDTCINFTSYIKVMDEFVKVSCGYDDKILYEQFFLFAPKKPSLSTKVDEIDVPQKQSAYNVIVLGIDSISRMNFYRTMPKTLAYLKKKGAIELLGYNKVGDNTFPNLTPMLLGIKDTDLKQTCWPSDRATFDNCSFIWKWYKHAGFYTALGEDSASLGTFNYGRFGFRDTPTDYYLRTFMREAEVHVGNNKDLNSFLCMGNKYFYKVLLDYIENLSKTLKSSKLFGFFWEVTMSHDYLNYPMLMDKSYQRFLRRLDNSKYLDDTILILLSDHGIRWGNIRFTKQGRLEERLPFVQILLAPSFRENYSLAYDNLKLNSKRLTTPFDIHATLSDLINLDSIKNEVIQSRTKMNYAQGRSISLFLPIPGNRSCHTAGIEDHWCTCNRNSKLQKASVESNEASAHLVGHLNWLLREHLQCAKLSLEEVMEVTEMWSGTPAEDEEEWRQFMVVVKTTPGGGVFEATLRRNSHGWELASTASRLNLYGNQSQCVHHYQLNHTIKTKGCSIPGMEPLSASIQKYINYPSSFKPCLNSSRSLLESDKKKIWVKKENLLNYNISETERENVLCCYQAFYRPTTIKDITSTSVDNRVNYDQCKYFQTKINVRDEFVRVICSYYSKKIYEQYFLFAPQKKFMKHDNKAEKSMNESAYNVLILGIDGVSRLNFQRTMPNTVNLLKSKGAMEMMGYNKVGDNTFPNLIPMLIGIKENELKKVCLPHRKATFDNCPFIWEWFKQAGYYTALGEDSSFLGTFNYVKVGFSNTPTDYYIHTFIDQAENNVGSNKDINTKLCMQEIPFYKVLLNYVEDLTTTLKSSRLFGFFWEISMSHDHLNYPMVMDDDYVQFFNRLEAKNYLDDTIVIVVSDHGIRWGGIRSTKQGRLEERLPFLFVLTPPSFRENYTRAYDHLKLNSKRLTTPFDLYATLSDLVDLNSINNTSLLSRSKMNYGHDRGISLFLPIPDNRTCKAADIEEHWCTCHKDVAVSKTRPEVLDAADSLLLNLNKMLAEYPQCARLSLSEVLDARMMEADKPGIKEVGWEEFMVLVVRTMPGGGIFEATLRIDDNGWALEGTVSRLNLYGQQTLLRNCNFIYSLRKPAHCNVGRNYPVRVLSTGICYKNTFYNEPINETKQVDFITVRKYTAKCPSSSGNPSQEPEEKKPGLIQRFRQMYKDYWYVLLPVHMCTSAIWFGSFYYAVRSGVDVLGILESYGVSAKLLEPVRNSGAGYLALAFALYKLATPLRYAVTVGGTTFAIKRLQAIGWIKPVPSRERLKEMFQEKRDNLQDRYNEGKQQMKEKRIQVFDEMRKYKAEMRSMKNKVKKM